MKTRRAFLLAVGTAAAGVPLCSLAQRGGKVWRVGFLATRRRPDSPDSDPYGQLPLSLHDLGYVEGVNLVIEWRYGGGDYDRLPELARELVRLPVDLVVTDGTPGIRAAQEATKTIPIVFAGGRDLVANGIVKSLARPGGNTTGVTLVFADYTAKQAELLMSMAPKTSHLAILFNPANEGARQQLAGFQTAALKAKVRASSLEARNEKEIEAAFSSMTRDRCDALTWTVDTFFFQQRRQIAELAARQRLPSMSGYPEYAEAGGLMSYGPNRRDVYRRVAAHVDKIFKGANPAELPVEQLSKLELVINRKTAKALGLTIPPELHLLADKVIE